jgi:pyruvate, water dikinase
MASPFIHWLEDLDRSQVASAGGKGASLGELRRAGVRVPPAFVVSRSAFDVFMAAADPQRRVAALLADLECGRAGVNATGAAILELLGPALLPESIAVALRSSLDALGAERLSVRSSAICEDGAARAWAGQLETFLNVAPDDVPAHVKACWLSIFRPSPLAYAAAHGYGADQFGVAAVVQKMVSSEVSGIGFSVHPVTQEPMLQLIEACFGLGEAIVSGAISPDQYVVDPAPPRIVENTRGRQQKGLFLDPSASRPEWRQLDPRRGAASKLSEPQILQYAALLDGIERHYGQPMDTEWALEGGVFHLLQARPITTLAAEYREAIVDASEPWQLLVRRPMSLLEVSILGHWIDTKHAGDVLGLHGDRYLAIQDTAGMATSFLSQRAMEAGLAHILDLDREDRERLIALLERGREVFRRGTERMESGAGFDDLDEAAEYLIEVGKFTVALPAWTLIALDGGHVNDPRVRELAEWLRARSLYPRVAHDLVAPIARKHMRKLGFSEPDRAPEVTTWREIHAGSLDRDVLEQRLAAVVRGERFVFQCLNEEERVRFVSETGYLLMRQAGQRQMVPPDDPNQIAGQAAWPGVHRGRARVVLSSDPEGYSLKDGEVLVSIQSNPNLMPLLRHAGAIVTDDGGIACHAGIICRELKIPTLIGTGRATSTIHDGDLVEVDATSQVVRILERAAGTRAP